MSKGCRDANPGVEVLSADGKGRREIHRATDGNPCFPHDPTLSASARRTLERIPRHRLHYRKNTAAASTLLLVMQLPIKFSLDPKASFTVRLNTPLTDSRQVRTALHERPAEKP